MASKPGKNVASQKPALGAPRTGIASTTRAATPAPPASSAQSRPGSAPVNLHTVATTNKPVTNVEAKPGVNLGAIDSTRPTREAVAEAAYFLWLQRGGSDVVNWLDAEASLGRKVKAHA